MLKLNKILILILLIGSVVLLTSCDYTYYIYHNTNGEDLFLDKEVTSIELIEYKNPMIEENPLKDFEFSSDKIEALETLEQENLIGFIEKISEIGGISSKLKNLLSSPHGKGIRITYNDDSFTLITVTNINGSECIFLGEYSAESKLGLQFGISWQDMIDEFKELINTYFVKEIY